MQWRNQDYENRNRKYRDRGSWRKTLRGGLLSDKAESIRPKRQCLLRLYDSLQDPTNSWPVSKHLKRPFWSSTKVGQPKSSSPPPSFLLPLSSPSSIITASPSLRLRVPWFSNERDDLRVGLHHAADSVSRRPKLIRELMFIFFFFVYI